MKPKISITRVNKPADPNDRKDDEPINLYFDPDFKVGKVAEKYKQQKCPNTFCPYVFFIEYATLPYKVVVHSKPDFCTVQIMYRNNQIYPFSVSDTLVSVYRENRDDGMNIGNIVSPRYWNSEGGADLFAESEEFKLYQCSRDGTDTEFKYRSENGSVRGALVLMELCNYSLAMNYIQAHFTVDELKQFNRNNGLYFTVDEAGEIHHKVVAGAERPDLMALFTRDGEVVMEYCRPYYEDSEFGKIDNELFDGLMGIDDDDTLNPDIDDLTEAAEDGDDEAMVQLAEIYLNGDDDVEQNPEQASYWMEKAAEKENARAQFNIGLHYAKGFGVERDFAKAVEWETRAAENGETDAVRLIQLFTQAKDDLAAAENEDAEAQARLSKFYTGFANEVEQAGPEKDYAEAFKWAGKSADQGCLEGIYCLGLCHYFGRGTPVNFAKATKTYRKAAELGHDPSQWNLAACYLEGKGVRKNQKLAAEWAEKAAAQGNILALNGMGHMYEEGIGVDVDIPKAISYVEKACELDPNRAESHHYLAILYLSPSEESPFINLDGAIESYRRAAALGDAGCGRTGNLCAFIRHLIVDEGMPEDTDFISYINQNGLFDEAIAYTG